MEKLSLKRTLKSKPLKRFSISETADKALQANIKGVEIHLVNKNNNEYMPATP